MAKHVNTVWLLPNFGSEEGLDWRRGMQTAVLHAAAKLWRSLFGRTARLLVNDRQLFTDLQPAPSSIFRGLPDTDAGVAWLSTTSAHAELRQLGVRPWGPTPEAVTKTHDKAFAQRIARKFALDSSPAAGLYEILDPSDFHDVASLAARIQGVLDAWPPWARQRWTLKPRYGAAGRGRVPGFGYGILSPQLEGSLNRFRDRGGAVLEPFLERVFDVSAQFFIHRPDDIEILGTLRQNLMVSGSYLGHEGILDGGVVRTGLAFEDELVRTSRVIVERAADEGLLGPCGVDAFAYRLGEDVFFRPGVELNARFTLGTIVIGVIQRLLATNESLQALAHTSLRWHFSLDGQVNESSVNDAVNFAFDTARLRFRR